MPDEEFFHQTRARFGIVGPPASEAEIEAVFPTQFPGKDDLVQFYLHHNGGRRNPLYGVACCGNREHNVTRDHLEKMEVEGFFLLGSALGGIPIRFRSMHKYHESRQQTFSSVEQVKDFLEQHMPIAFDHCGNDFWIDLCSGQIRYMLWETWREGAMDFAASFKDFVTRYWLVDSKYDYEGAPVDGVRQFETVTGFKYGTKEAIEYCARLNKEKNQ